MTNLLLEIWLEQKSHLWRFVGKLVFIVLALFSGLLLSGFPFTFWIVMMGVFWLNGTKPAFREEIGGVRALPEMIYLIPRPLSGMKQYALQKNRIRAVFYAGITILGYGITIGSTEGLSLNGEMLLVLILLFCYQTILFFYYYFYQFTVVFQNVKSKDTLVRLEYLLAGMILSGLCYYEFSGCTAMAFLKNPLWWMGSIVVILIIFIIQCRQIQRSMKQMVIRDYRR